MDADRTGYARTPGGGGLIFDWQTHRTPRFGKLGIFAIAVCVLVLPLSILRINLGNPPIQETQSASMMMLTPQNDPMHWLDAARDLGPFPTRFDPVDWQPSQALVEDVLAKVRDRTIPPYQPRYRDLPAEGPPPPLPLVVKGSRVLPTVAAPDFERMDAIAVRSMPTLYPLTGNAAVLPEISPPFEAEVSPEMADQPWRFILQISPDGSVLHAVAMVGHNAPGLANLTAWLHAHQFPSREEPRDRWIAVAVTFQNQRANGTDDP